MLFRSKPPTAPKATPVLKPYVLTISLVVLVGLFAMQRFGTSLVGKMFGPVICVWFAVLAVTGAVQVLQAPAILAALNPLEAVGFLREQGWHMFVALGAIVLAFTGAEALYAGPRLWLAAWAAWQRARGWARMDFARAAQVLFELHCHAGRVTLRELAKSLPDVDVAEALAELRLLRGVLVLESPPPGAFHHGSMYHFSTSSATSSSASPDSSAIFAVLRSKSTSCGMLPSSCEIICAVMASRVRSEE